MAEKASKDFDLKPEAIDKWNKDLSTIHSLTELSIKNDDNFVLKGGMATEAYLGGKQRRAHGDIDATYYLLGQTLFDKLVGEVDEILNSEETSWKKYDSPIGKIEYRETDDEREFLDRRRLEMYVREDFGEAYETGQYQVKKLIDSTGNEQQVKVMDLAELVAMKIRNIFLSKNSTAKQGRDSVQSDYDDLENLIMLEDFDKEKVIDLISGMLKKFEGNVEQKRLEAERQHDFVMQLLAKRN